MSDYMSSEIYNLRLVIWDQCVVSAIHQTIQSFVREQIQKIGIEELLQPGGMKKIFLPTANFQEIYLISGCCSGSPNL